METFLKRDLRSAIFVVALTIMGASIAYLVVTEPDSRSFWAMTINIFLCLTIAISVGIGITKQRKEEQER